MGEAETVQIQKKLDKIHFEEYDLQIIVLFYLLMIIMQAYKTKLDFSIINLLVFYIHKKTHLNMK